MCCNIVLPGQTWLAQPGGGDFGFYLVPGLGQHRELRLDGFLWHAAASAELLADVLPLSQRRCLAALENQTELDVCSNRPCFLMGLEGHLRTHGEMEKT